MNAFDTIYQTAITRNNTTLERYKRNYSIDESKQGRQFWSAASQLAYEGKIAAVEWLLARGSNINYAAIGAAAGKHKQYALTLLQRGASIQYVAQGAAMSGDFEFVEELLIQKADKQFIAVGAAFAGHVEYAMQFIPNVNVTLIARAAAQGDHQHFADECITTHGALIDTVGQGAAMGGHKEHAMALLMQGANIQKMIHGAAGGGHRGFTKTLIYRFLKDNLLKDLKYEPIARHAAEGGHNEQTEELIRRDCKYRNNVAEGAAAGGHFAYVERLMQRSELSYSIKRGLRQTPQITNRKESQLAHLPNFKPKALNKILDDFVMEIPPDIKQKIIKMSQYIHTNQLQYNLARLKTDTDCQGLVYLLFTLYRAEKHTLPFSLLQISNEVFYACIFTFLSPYTTPDDFKQLGQFEYEQFIERFKPKKTVEPNPHDNNQWSCVMQ
jgi:hypothetical protein